MQMHSKFVLAAILASSALIASAEDVHHPADAPVDSAENTAPASTAMTKAMTEQMQKMQAAHDKAAAAKIRQASLLCGDAGAKHRQRGFSPRQT